MISSSAFAIASGATVMPTNSGTQVTSQLKKTGYRNLMNGKLFDHKKVKYKLYAGGIIEACYHENTAKEMFKLAEREHGEENIGFICATNYLLCRKSGVGAKTGRVAGIDRHVTYEQAMAQIFQKYVRIGSDNQINIDYRLRGDLTSNEGAYCSSGNISKLIKAREACVFIVYQNIGRTASEVPISSSLVKYLKMENSPTDQEVKRRLSFPDWF